MNQYIYHMAHDCPQCGAQDSPDSWGGARMWSTAWGHSFSCCSEKCGEQFAIAWRGLIKTKAGRKRLRKLWEKLQHQSDAVLSGEPYPGYDAEDQLRQLGRY